jgi:predicted transposase/invertase (TIGR01784 family)
MIINMVENPFFTISNDYLFKAIMSDEEIRKYIFKVCFDKKINIKKISNVELLKENKNLKGIITDIKLEDEKNVYLVEMQNKNEDIMIERWLYSISRVISTDLNPRKEHKNLRKITTFIIQNNHEIKEDIYKLIGTINKEILTDKIELCVFDIPKELKSKIRGKRILAELFRVKNEQELEIVKVENEIEKKIIELIKRYNKNKKEYEKMLEEEEVMGLMDIKIGKAEERGEARGKARGEIIGANNKTVELAKKMLKENISTDVISKVTGLSKKVLMTML